MTHPDSFPGAGSLTGDRGGWTVVFSRVEDGAGKAETAEQAKKAKKAEAYEAISYPGFHVAR
ncbi:hypothetical protein [Streptomyces sp. NPDC058701]|uniref:hypothetical protein n=1 Tax=Streptomyces sp. NPDC058701 TaxID=3346608 RepID=UPI0036587F0C